MFGVQAIDFFAQRGVINFIHRHLLGFDRTFTYSSAPIHSARGNGKRCALDLWNSLDLDRTWVTEITWIRGVCPPVRRCRYRPRQQNGIFFRVSIVTGPPTHFGEPGGSVEVPGRHRFDSRTSSMTSVICRFCKTTKAIRREGRLRDSLPLCVSRRPQWSPIRPRGGIRTGNEQTGQARLRQVPQPGRFAAERSLHQGHWRRRSAPNAALRAGWRQSPSLDGIRPSATHGPDLHALMTVFAEDFGIGAAEIMAIQKRHVGEVSGSNRGRSKLHRIRRCRGRNRHQSHHGPDLLQQHSAQTRRRLQSRRADLAGRVLPPRPAIPAGSPGRRNPQRAEKLRAGGHRERRIRPPPSTPGLPGGIQPPEEFPRLGQPLGGAEPDANPGEAARPMDHDDAADVPQA